MKYYQVKYKGANEYQWASQKYLDESNITIPKDLFDRILATKTWMNRPRRQKLSMVTNENNSLSRIAENDLFTAYGDNTQEVQLTNRIDKANKLMLEHFGDIEKSVAKTSRSINSMYQKVTDNLKSDTQNRDIAVQLKNSVDIETNAINNNQMQPTFSNFWQDIIPGICASR